MRRGFALGLSLALALLLSGTGQAEVAVVRGGEHPEFTRIVVTAAAAGDWRLGRTDDGYALALGPAITGYDLAQAFERIPRDRVSALWRDPETGQLRFSLSCPCFAVAFEFRPGMVVIDIKTGQPPAGSAFEEPLSPPAGQADARPEVDPGDGDAAVGANRLAEGEAAAPGDTPAGYDWLDLRRQAPPDDGAALPLPLAVEDPLLDPLRAALLAQISRGAAEGVVEIAEHPALPDASGQRAVEAPGMRIATGELPGLTVAGVHDPGPNLTADGGPCLADADLDVAGWMLTGPIAAQIGPGRAGLLGEFDTPDAMAIRRAARLHVALGFGAEAQQYLDMLPDPETEEAQRLRAMAQIVDQDPAGGSAIFAPMAGCDTAAALWAALALSAAETWTDSQVAGLNRAAVARSFSALPVHLRRQLGPRLVERMLAAGDGETARLLRDAILRAPGDGGPAVALMDAHFDLEAGSGEKAGRIAAEVAGEAGTDTPEALALLVEAAFRTGGTLPADLPATLAAYRKDAVGTSLEPRLRRAALLASALLGDFPAAFAELPATPDSAADLWSLAATGAEDDLFLAQAVVAAAATPPPVAEDVAMAVAERLYALGFAAEALIWLGPVDARADPARRRLAAAAALMLRDARGAALLLAGMDDAESLRLLADAVRQQGDLAAVVAALDRAGDAEGRDRAIAWSGQWDLLAEAGADPWKTAASLAGAETGDAADGPLARGTALASDSAAARAAAEALLAAVPAPDGS